MQKLAQRIALLSGALCLGVGLLLVLISHLSSRYILEQQVDRQDQALAERLAADIAPVIAQGDLIRLEVLLGNLLEQHQLHLLSVRDLEERPLGHAGGQLTADSRRYQAALTVDQHLAGEVIIARRSDPALEDQRSMALGLLGLAVLASVFVAAIARHLAQPQGLRLAALQARLSRDNPGADDEITALERAVENLPLDLLAPVDDPDSQQQEFQEAGLLYVRLESLTHYVETLDEQSLLRYTRRLQALVEGAAELYSGAVSVSREFGLLVLFSGSHASGSPAFRCISCAWLLRQVASSGQGDKALKVRLGLSCALGEAARCERTGRTDRSIYPDLYNQHIINDLAAAAADSAAEIRLLGDITTEEQVSNRARLDSTDSGTVLAGFEDPYADALERQTRLLLSELLGAG